MNVRPKNYSWPDFYRNVIDLGRHTFSGVAIARRFGANRGLHPKWMNVVRAVSSEGFGRIKYNTEIFRRLTTDVHCRSFFEQEATTLPKFYEDLVRKDLGLLWSWLPPGALHHDPNAYLNELDARSRGRESAPREKVVA
jgi:hypothetical protein